VKPMTGNCKSKSHQVLFFCSIAIFLTAITSTAEDFNDFRKQELDAQSSFSRNYLLKIDSLESDTAFFRFKDDIVKLYQGQLDRHKKQIALFKREVIQQWGTFNGPQERVITLYNTADSNAAQVDFINNTIEIRVLSPVTDTGSLARNRIEKAVRRMAMPDTSLPSPTKTIYQPYPDLLSGLLLTDNGLPLRDLHSVISFCKEKAAGATWRSLDNDATKNGCYVLTLKITPDNVDKMLQRTRPVMLRVCTQFGVDTGLVSAIIRSGLPRTFFDRYNLSGYGLMRLSLDNEGAGAHVYLYGQGHIPRSESIFNPDMNIELGCAYLYEINKKYSGITDKRSRMYCAIAAYGSKPEDVARAITGEMELGKAIIAINTIGNHDEVYQKLLHGLPEEKSKRFFKEVLSFVVQEPNIK